MMDPFGSNTNHDTLSLQEMIDCDIQAEFDGTEFTCPTRASTVLELPGDPSNSSMTTMDLESDLMIGVNGARGSVTANTGHVQWMTAMDFDTPGLLVNPQTGLPIQPLYTCVSRPATSPAPADTPGAQTPASVNHRLLTEPTGADAAPSHSPGLHQVDSSDKKVFPKPAYSYSCLIAMALKNSKTGSLPVSEIYSFMTENFPYFKTAPNGWKNSVRHNLSLNKCFEKVEKPMGNSGQRKGCLWAMNPAKVGKMEEEVQKWGRKDPQAIKRSMARPENLELLEKGCLQGSFLQGQELRALAPGPCPSNPPLKLKGEPLDTDLGLIDTSLPLDTSLPDLNFQSDIWDELNDERLHFGISMATDIPSPSSVTMTTTSGTLIDCSASVSLSSSNLVQGSNYVCTSTTINNNNTSQSLVNHHNNNHKVELQQRNPSESNVVHGQIMCKNGRSLSAFM